MGSAMGWIKLHRQLQDNWLWKNEKFSRGQAWVDILLEVNHTEQKFLIGGTLRKCERGQSLNSVKTWALRWGWTESAVRRFFKLLESDGMISVKGDTQTTTLTVCNYGDYQETRRTDGEQVASERRTDGEQTATNKKGKKEKKEKKEYAENVTMTEDEYDKLCEKHGKQRTDWMIYKLDNYKGSQGRKYASDYRAILSWVVEECYKVMPQNSGTTKNLGD